MLLLQFFFIHSSLLSMVWLFVSVFELEYDLKKNIAAAEAWAAEGQVFVYIIRPCRSPAY